MKFNYIVGNPPYQNSNSEGSNSKLWKDITLKMFNKYSQEMTFVTPQSAVLLLTKTPEIKYVDYNSNDYFNVGVDIISWGVSKSSEKCPLVFSTDGTVQKDKKLWNNTQRVQKTFFERIKGQKGKKLFVRDIGVSDGSYKIWTNFLRNKQDLSQKPVLYKKKKLAISSSRAFKEEYFIIGDDDFGSIYAMVDLTDVTDFQYKNLLSFLFHPLVLRLQQEYKKVHNTGFNNLLWHIPEISLKNPYDTQMVQKVFNFTLDEIEYFSTHSTKRGLIFLPS